MSHADRKANNVAAIFHPVSHYDTPEDVLNDEQLSSAEKRVILSSWASDMYAVESQPALRKIPGTDFELCLDDILSALKQLDDNDPPPGGGMSMRLPRLRTLDCGASNQPQRFVGGNATKGWYQSPPGSGTSRGSRWTGAANVQRYRKLLRTHLTDLERNYIERRLAEQSRG